MSGYRTIEIFNDYTPSTFIRETSIFKPQEIDLGFALDLFNPITPFDFTPPFLCSPFDTITDLIQIEKSSSSPSPSPLLSAYQKYQAKKIDSKLMCLADRVSALELGIQKAVKGKKAKDLDRKYSWTAEIKVPEKDGVDKRYKWSTEIKAGKKEEKNYKYVAEYKGKGKDSAIDRKYIFKAASALAQKDEKVAKKKNDCKAIKATPARVVEIEEEDDQGATRLKQIFEKSRQAGKGKGKKKELYPQDAAIMIQMSFRAYLIRRSKLLRALRDLAVAKTKLKELRSLFNNFSYRRCIARDAEEKQKFSEKIIVLLLTVDAIEGVDLMVRAAKRSIVNELEAMLDVVDPQPTGRLGSLKRRTFDMPDGTIQKEIAAGVAEVVQMLEQDEKDEANTFEVCL